VNDNEAVVNPQKSRSSPAIGPVAVMAATRPDLIYLSKLFGFSKDDYQCLFLSRLYFDRNNPGQPSVTGPFVGAPYAVMLLENLIAWGARQIIFIGWCGAISDQVHIGDVILPTSVYIDEGTSRHYGTGDNLPSQLTFPLVPKVRQTLDNNKKEYHAGAIWTTDAVYRETRGDVAVHQKNGVLAVEMEFSALASVARYRGVDLAGLLVVSDELSSLSWRPGFKQQQFIQSRQSVCMLIKDLVKYINPGLLGRVAVKDSDNSLKPE
jgi:purine-nucleoside phosphorylase